LDERSRRWWGAAQVAASAIRVLTVVETTRGCRRVLEGYGRAESATLQERAALVRVRMRALRESAVAGGDIRTMCPAAGSLSRLTRFSPRKGDGATTRLRRVSGPQSI
jgi:hypothetical protein